MKLKLFLTIAFFFFFALSINAKNEEPLTPFLKKSVSYSDSKKVESLKNKAFKAYWKHDKHSMAKQVKYYLEAAKLGDYESQVAMGYYYGFSTCQSEDVCLDANTLSVSDPTKFHPINKAAAWYFLNSAAKNEKSNDNWGNAQMGLALLSIDSIKNEKVAEIIYTRALYTLLSLEEYNIIEPRTYMWPLDMKTLARNTGKIIVKFATEGISINKDFLTAYYASTFINNKVNMPNDKKANTLSRKVIELIGQLPYSDENRKYGIGLVSAILLKKAVDLYSKNPDDREIRFWVDRALYADKNNSQAYYFVGNLYLNGDAALPKDRKLAEEWFFRAQHYGSLEASHALSKIYKEIVAETEQALVEQRKKEEKRQRRQQAWAQILGTAIQTVGNAFNGIQGNNTPNLLNPNMAISQVINQQAQLNNMQQSAFQSIQMPQIEFKFTAPPTFTFDWSKIDWTSAPIDNYYQYQGDLINNGVGTTVESKTGNQSSFTNTGATNEKTCHLCHGIKKCWTCNGKRMYINPLTGKYVTCPNCTNGWCSRCNGTGKL